MKTNDIKCGIIMPISEIEGCNETHWKDLLSIFQGCITESGLSPILVSDADNIGVIQKRIIDNLYSNPIVLCDISCRNSNVMFELGIRLAFDKPTIIVKDDMTPFSFDTSIIETIIYPRDLNYTKILTFREQLKHKIQGTLSESQKNTNYSTFLKHFGQYKIVGPKETDISADAFIIKSLNELNERVNQLARSKKSKYGNSIDFRNLEFENQYVLVDFSDFYLETDLRKIYINRNATFRSFLDYIFYQLEGKVKPFTYEFDWVLVNLDNGLKIESARLQKNILKGQPFQDNRALSELGIFPKTKIKVSKL